MEQTNKPSSPLFRDPIYDGAADPTIIWNHQENQWWMIYTNRRATLQTEGVAWVHGTDLGVASSTDGTSWLYRGTLQGLEIEPGRNTYWAPEVLYENGLYHMYVSYIQGVPSQWAGHKRQIIHYTSENLWDWNYQSSLKLSSDYVIDACVYRLPNGKYRMWYKDEANHSHTYAADSDDLYSWEVVGPVITDFPHEGANVFYLNDFYWMVVDTWKGQAVYRSNDCEEWTYQKMILNEPGHREDDDSLGYHADVLVEKNHAYIFYFTHPGRGKGFQEESYEVKRTSIQVAKIEVKNGKLTCDRNQPFSLKFSVNN